MFQPNIIQDEREAEQHSSAISGQTIVAAARLIKSALSSLNQELKNRELPVVDLAAVTENQKSAYVVALTTERYGIPQADGGKSFDTEKYRFSVSQEGVYRVADKESNWVLLKFRANREFAQAKVADLTETLISEKEDFTPETAEAAAAASVDDLLDTPNNSIDPDSAPRPAFADENEFASSGAIPDPFLNRQASAEQERRQVGTPSDAGTPAQLDWDALSFKEFTKQTAPFQSEISPDANPQEILKAHPELADLSVNDALKNLSQLDNYTPDQTNQVWSDWDRLSTSAYSEQPEAENQSKPPAPIQLIEENLETSEEFGRSLPDPWLNGPPIKPASSDQSNHTAVTEQPNPDTLAVAQIADQLIEESGGAATSPESVEPKVTPKVKARGYASEEFDITQVDNLYDIRDKSGNSVFSFIKDENRYEILEDNLTPEQRQQFIRAYDNIQKKSLDSIMADPTGNRQLDNLGALAPEGSKAIAFTHQNLSEQQKISGAPGPNFQTETDRYRFSKENNAITITSQIDNRVVASSTADGRISANFLDSEEASSFSNAYEQMKQQAQQQAQKASQTSVPQQGQHRKPIDMER